MKKLCTVFAAFFFAVAAHAQTINNLGAGRGSVIGTDLFPSYQGANPAVRPSAAQIAAYVFGRMSGDGTANGTGGFTLASVNSNVGTFGSATQCTVVTVNAKGLITAASQVTCTPAMSSVTGRAALSQLPQGIANSIWINPTGSTADMQNVAVPACANDGVHALVYVNGTGLQCAALTTGGGGTVTSVTCGSGLTGGAITVSGTCLTAANDSAVSTATYTLLTTDYALIKRFTNASTVTITVPVSTGFAALFYTTLKCESAAGCSTSGTIDGSASAVAIANGNSLDLYLDGSGGWHKLPGNGSGGAPTGAAGGDLAGTYPNPTLGFASASAAAAASDTDTFPTNQGAGTLKQTLAAIKTWIKSWIAKADVGLSNVPNTLPGAGVSAAIANNLSAAGGLTSTIASGTSALGTGAITSATCATVVTTAATNTATTDVVTASFNGDPTAVTGYIPATAGMLTIIAYPTSGNVNFKVCNNTSGSITPGAITLNWRVVR